ncbi:Mono-functional DNA-alkylating methyl methanesulfonate N-term [Teratosphaeria destructans]|uniref:Mono-functional DNA-alkylating methyl methanesulfonate N-term n=1 Tax=Teratosphaeria destructans TaxID=418781 RepID=A0A9W7SPE5_9PEZI|nr:Mono-functional DNA-alkylating methyl methanesulfonate N-term [Teratosphaeria destructans]
MASVDFVKNHMSAPKLGILTKTIIEPSVVKWILHARLRSRWRDDVVFIGEDFIHVKHVGHDGHLEHVAFKNDFDARIRAAKVLCLDLDTRESEDYHGLKLEDGSSSDQCGSLPHDLLVLTLDSPDDLLFLYIQKDENGRPQFRQQSRPMPRAETLGFQPGHHLAVDPQSRAMAVAANQQEIVIYAIKDLNRVRDRLQMNSPDWIPTSTERQIQVSGVIQHMDFLIPSDDDSGHIILLLVVAENSTTKAMWLDWSHASDLKDVQVHPMQALDASNTSTNLLIPLSNTTFILTIGNVLKLCKDLLSGSLKCTEAVFDFEARHAGSSTMQPLWVSWCRPPRTRASRRKYDCIYLVREDGSLHYLELKSSGSIFSSTAGHFECHVDTAFASLSDTDPGADILAVAGNMSTGRLVSIGPWPSLGRNIELTYRESMTMDLIEAVPNWASITDLIAMPSRHTAHRPTRGFRPGVYVTSGRQPYGAIAELRSGLEARLSTYFTLDELHSVTKTWAVPLVADGSILVFLAFPSATRVLKFSADPGNETQELSDDACPAWDLSKATLAAAATPDGRLIHVSTSQISVTSGMEDNWEDTRRRVVHEDVAILGAAILSEQSVVITIESDGLTPRLHYTPFAFDDEDADGEARGTTMHLEIEPTAVAAAVTSGGIIAVVASVDGKVRLFEADSDCSTIQSVDQSILPPAPAGPGICDHLAVLRSGSGTDLLLICGLRDGRVFCQKIEPSDTAVSLGTTHTFDFAQSTVRLTALQQFPSAVCAMSGAEICLIEWTGLGADDLDINRIWVSDQARSDLSQGTVVAITQMPSSDLLASPLLADAVVLVSPDEFQVTMLQKTPTVVPRRIPVSGSPARMLYAERQQCLVVASTKTEALSDMRRKIWPVIDFITVRNAGVACTYDLQPGERVYSLLEWNYKSSDDKTYSFVLVGSSYTRRSGGTGGRIRFLQQSGRDASEVREGHVEKFDAPVFSTAIFDELTYVVCYGESVALFRFQQAVKKWRQLCEPFKLLSPGVYVTVTAPLIFISAANDSLVTLRLVAYEDEGETVYELTCVRSGPRADRLTSHLIVRPDLPGGPTGTGLALLATREQSIVGITCDAPDNTVPTHATSAELLFEADLPRSITRLRQSDLRPRWKDGPPDGVVVDNIIGSAPDGALFGIALLDERLWKRLSWLQRLCEWDAELSPHSHQTPPYCASDENYAGEDRALPVGLAAGGDGDHGVILRTHVPKRNDKHINGDVLVRLLKRGGSEKLKSMIMEAAERNDRAGEWIADHMEDELAAVDEIIGILKPLLDCWM